MREEYLHYLFRTKRLGNSFKTTTGANLQVKKFGEQNPNAGPDFLDTQIVLDNTTWAGSIEFHVKSSDWFLHKHQVDSRYHTVIAHFVLEHDKEVQLHGHPIPTVELKDTIDWEHYQKFRKLAASEKTIPCASVLKTVTPEVIRQQLENAVLQRLFRKSDRVLADLSRLRGDREKAVYLSVARVFGGKVNADSFEMLMEKIDLRMLQKMTENELAIPAVLFGMAGLLPAESNHAYVKALIHEFKFQKHRLNLKPLNAEAFRFSRMHPPGFPTFRLAQLAEIICRGIPVGQITSGNFNVAELRDFFSIALPDFWQTHYHFEKETTPHNAGISEAFMDLVIINTFAPCLFAIGRLTNSQKLTAASAALLAQTRPEVNTVIRTWQKMGVKSQSAFDTQALVEQKTEFCAKKQCLKCHIGHAVLTH
ncbi:MAG: DUF2851 family protein [Bacteroidetes bacterium]|nr:DUF2851 family protein [Bacteroidota bacterium]